MTYLRLETETFIYFCIIPLCRGRVKFCQDEICGIAKTPVYIGLSGLFSKLCFCIR